MHKIIKKILFKTKSFSVISKINPRRGNPIERKEKKMNTTIQQRLVQIYKSANSSGLLRRKAKDN